MAILLAEAARRDALSPLTATTAADFDASFRHWYIDGGDCVAMPHPTQVSYAQLEQPHAQLLGRIQRAIYSGGMGPEQLCTLLARMAAADVGLSAAGADDVLNHFRMTLLTEGAGTQISRRPSCSGPRASAYGEHIRRHRWSVTLLASRRRP